jgi:hypothetical protein
MAENQEELAAPPAAGKPKKVGKARKRKTAKKKRSAGSSRKVPVPSFPRHSVTKVLRVPKAILEQNAGKSCTEHEALKFAGLSYHGPSRVELSSAIKYGFLERPKAGYVAITELAKKVIRPQKPTDEIDGLRHAVLNAPTISDVYTHYRGENVPMKSSFVTRSLIHSAFHRKR